MDAFMKARIPYKRPERITKDNPMGMDGLEFIEFAAADPHDLEVLFTALGFKAVGQHRSRHITLWRQGDINFIINAERTGFSFGLIERHGSCVCAVALRVADAGKAVERAMQMGASLLPFRAGPMELNIPGIEGVGGSHIYFVDRYGERGAIYDVDFVPIKDSSPVYTGAGLQGIDHLSHNVYRGNMNRWAAFYEHYFGFLQSHYFEIESDEGTKGLKSRVMASPCGKIHIPINESFDDKSPVEEFLHIYKGEGVQHIALSTDDISATIKTLEQAGVKFLPSPDHTRTKQLISDGEQIGSQRIEALKNHGVLVDSNESGELSLHIFTDAVIGPIFFEIIERQGSKSFSRESVAALFANLGQTIGHRIYPEHVYPEQPLPEQPDRSRPL